MSLVRLDFMASIVNNDVDVRMVLVVITLMVNVCVHQVIKEAYAMNLVCMASIAHIEARRV